MIMLFVAISITNCENFENTEGYVPLTYNMTGEFAYNSSATKHIKHSKQIIEA